MKNLLIASTFFVVSSFNLTSAYAADPLPLPTQRVSIADLDLTAAAGRQTLQRRIHHAVTALCGTIDSRELAGRRATVECHRAAQASTRTQVVIATTMAERRVRIAALQAVKTADIR